MPEKRASWLFGLFVLLLFPSAAFAYIDPGTGGMIVGSIIPALITVAAVGWAFLARKKKKLLILIIIALVLILAYWAFANMDFGNGEAQFMGQGRFKKVLVLGLDGMDPKITRQMMEEGKLPNFSKLAEEGSFLELDTSYPPHSPVAWTSIATGTNPGKHNVFDFIRSDRQRQLPELTVPKTVSGIAGTGYESLVRSAPFWRLSSDAGMPTTVIKWPVSFPPERIKGKMLAGLGVPDVRGMLSGYTYYTESPGGGEKHVQVEREGNIVRAKLFGPKKQGIGGLEDVTKAMEARVLGEGEAEIVVDGKSERINVGEWSRWIRVKFDAGFMQHVYGIFRAYLVNIDPFEMYVSTIHINPEKPFVDISFPKEYSAELVEEIGLYHTLGIAEETDGIVDGKLSEEAFLQQVAWVEEERERLFWEEFNKFRAKDIGIYAFVFDSSDRMQHIFWEQKMLEGFDQGNRIKVSPRVEDYWVEKDGLLGKILDGIDGDTLLLVVSDHGFTSFEKAVSINTLLVENGFMRLERELHGEEGGLFEFVDWQNTKAYSLGFNSIYVNVKGREAKGIVEAGEREKVVDEVIAALEKLEDEGKPVFHNLYRREEIYSGDNLENAPDIIIGYKPGFRTAWQTAVGGFAEKAVTENKKAWNGDHLVDPSFVPGVLFSNTKLVGKRAKQEDVCPTILKAVGINVPAEADGKSLLE